VEASCIAVLERLGFVVTQELSGGEEEWLALREDLHLRAESPLQLLGLLTMREHRGEDWAPTDSEVQSMLKRCGLK
jgi:hypothetical protein